MNLAYMAGFFDGEGCIQFSRCRTTHYPRVLLVNTNKEILQEFCHRFGGDIKPLALRKDGWKQGWMWRLSWSRAVNFISKIAPYLKLKQLQAQTIFAWDAVRPGNGTPWDKETLDLLLRRMTWLNQKGLSTDPDPIDEELYNAQR